MDGACFSRPGDVVVRVCVCVCVCVFLVYYLDSCFF